MKQNRLSLRTIRFIGMAGPDGLSEKEGPDGPGRAGYRVRDGL